MAKQNPISVATATSRINEACEKIRDVYYGLRFGNPDYMLDEAAGDIREAESLLNEITSRTVVEAKAALEKLQSALDAKDRDLSVRESRTLLDEAVSAVGKLTGADHTIKQGMREPVNVYHHELKTSLKKTKEFIKKGLCTHQAPIELSCGHQCLYCSTPAMMRTQDFFKDIGRTAFERGFSVIDSGTAERIAKSIPKRMTADDVVMVSTTADAWSPEALEVGLGRKILEVLLEKTSAKVRILTKNAAVAEDFDLVEKYKDRVMVGLSTGIPRSRAEFAEMLEPNASTPADRFDALRDAHENGLRTYGMICPCPPGVSDGKEHLEELFDEVLACGVEDIWLEPLNPRGRAMINCETALRRTMKMKEAEAVNMARKDAGWSAYATDLIETSVAVAKARGALDKLHILLYPKGLTDEDSCRLEKYGKEVIWL